jgi:transcriptional regulator with XRE-family HTH domain
MIVMTYTAATAGGHADADADADLPQPPRPRGRRHGPDRRRRPDGPAVPRFDIAGLIRRARRNARLSQRAMAEAIGVGKSTIGQAERDGGSVTLPVLLAALAVGGIELVPMSGDDEVPNMRPDELRDRRGRKLPAHQYAWVASETECVPSWWRGSSTRNAPVRWTRHYTWVDILHLPLYHPGPDDLAIARRKDEDRRAFQQARLMALRHARAPVAFTVPDCTCSDECIARARACPPSCPCQCDAPAR